MDCHPGIDRGGCSGMNPRDIIESAEIVSSQGIICALLSGSPPELSYGGAAEGLDAVLEPAFVFVGRFGTGSGAESIGGPERVLGPAP
ncbi:hypothetical protein KHHGKMAE_3697 [Methylobacterium persicinum]|nr:hypothetical protein KHHGKMAE_3697 [Methylobacterium persicinum]